MEKEISKVSFMWVVVMVGFAMHMLADLLPIFWGANVTMPDATGEASVGMMAFMISLSFFMPMCGLLCMQYRSNKTMRLINFVLATIMMVFNILHASELFMEFSPVQLMIHPVMIIAGIYLFIFSRREMKQQ
ncbi:MAG: hypothetical protein J6S89_10720 [Paludibacteraceae bacterium]|nr:hypothetical protein [Paludibacteraceae bacterium]